MQVRIAKPRRRQRQVLLGAKSRRIFLVGRENFVDNLGHGLSFLVVDQLLLQILGQNDLRVNSKFSGLSGGSCL
jgi:hypothetical protein